jgi:exopolyphosphatase / guanosine-5'-triphosphate,3'-diphosphate pyrophosphatase
MISAPPRPLRLAGIDIGTLTCRLLIADLSSGHSLHELKSDRRILRLGEGVDRTKRLGAGAMDRVIDCLREWRRMIDSYRVDAATAVATSAVRDAANRDEFLERAKREARLDVEVITGEEEAQRTLLGIRSGLPSGVADLLALDIGGGSTEFILDRPGYPPMVKSIDIGVVRLCERVLRHDPPSADEIQQARDWVRRGTESAVAGMPRFDHTTFVGTAGTITSLAAMAQKLPAYEPARIHNYRLTLATIQALENMLLSRTKAQRVGLPGLEKNREEVIAAGAIIIRTIMETLGEQECLVSDLGLREGVLIDLAEKIESPKELSVIGGQLFQPIADLVEGLLKRPFRKPDRIGSNYFEGGYSAAIIVLLVAVVESLVQRDRYFCKRTGRSVIGSDRDTVAKYMKVIHGYRRPLRLVELMEVRNAVAHNHLWEIKYVIPHAGGRRHKGSALVAGTHKLRNAPLPTAKVPRTKSLRLNLQPQRLDRTDVLKALSESLHLLKFLSRKGYQPIDLTRTVIHMNGRRLLFMELMEELKKTL